MVSLQIVCVLTFVMGVTSNNFFLGRTRKVSLPTCSPLKLENGRVRFKSNTGFAQFACRKGFILAGERYAKCFLGQWEGEVPVCVKNTCSKPKDIQNGFVYPSHRGGVLNYFCKAEHKIQGQGVLYCNGKSWSSYLPTCIHTDVEPSLNCDFEREDLCGWTHDINHDFDWIRSNFSTPSGHIGTGPAHDHTPHMNGQGFYMYIEATSRNINDTARLISPVYKAQENNTCLEFYYHMYGASAGELRVYCKKVSTNWTIKAEDEVFWRGGDQGNQWRRGLVTLGPIEDEFQIIFEGIRGGSYLSDIAIDDVKIIENCMEEELTTVEDTIDTTTIWSTFDYETEYSCLNRCGMEPQPGDLCNCSTGCLLNNSCCPDFIAVCILGEEGTTEEDLGTTTEDPTTITTSTTEMITTTTIPIVKTTEMITTTTRRTTPPTTTTTKRTTPITTPTTPITKPSTTTRKPTTTTRKPTTTTRKPTVPTTKPTPPLTKATIPTTKATILTTKPTTPPTTKPTTPTTKSTTPPTTISTTKQTIPIVIQKTIARATIVKKAAVQKKMSWYVVTLITLSVIIVLSALLFIVVHEKRRGCRRYRRSISRRSFDDSQSDVRFLTSDEILNFNLDE